MYDGILDPETNKVTYLGKEYDVDEIVYYNRRDCCQSRANGMVVQIFDNNMSQSQFTQGNFTLNSDMKQVITLNKLSLSIILCI